MNDNKEKLVRIDRNLAHNANMFSVFGKREQLVFSLLVYFCETWHKVDIFGSYRLDPYEFAKSMGYSSIGKLFERVEVPYQLSDDTGKVKKNKRDMLERNKEDIFETILEDALYMMGNKNLEIKKGKAYQNGELVEIDFLQILKKLKILEVGKKKKKYYDLIINPILIQNLKYYFDHIQRSAFIQCRNHNLNQLYFYVCSLREWCLHNGKDGTPSFDLLCSYAKVNDTDVSQRKKKLKSKVEKLIKIDESLNFDFSFIKNENDRFAFQPRFVFNASTDHRLNKSIQINQDKLVFAYNDIEKRLKQFYYNRYNIDDQKEGVLEESIYGNWKQHESDSEMKIDIIYKTIEEYFPKNFKNWTRYPDGKGYKKQDILQLYVSRDVINTKGLF